MELNTMKLNNKGHSFIDVMVAMTILMTSLLMMFQFLGFLKENKYKQDVNVIVLQSIQNESEKAYRTANWEMLSGDNYEAPGGILESGFSGYHITVYNTESVTLTVSLNDFSQSLLLERSVYWND